MREARRDARSASPWQRSNNKIVNRKLHHTLPPFIYDDDDDDEDE